MTLTNNLLQATEDGDEEPAEKPKASRARKAKV